ncbi:hypothetical protein L6258_00300, partial [Candidatus Parcubacteria bacterium]|nr:hypothetical protein [Candidatus Parcubacteria bacterium]
MTTTISVTTRVTSTSTTAAVGSSKSDFGSKSADSPELEGKEPGSKEFSEPGSGEFELFSSADFRESREVELTSSVGFALLHDTNANP